MRAPWTLDELREVGRRLRAEMESIEEEDPDIRPLPPMRIDEAKDLLFVHLQTARSRPLTGAEVCTCSQLLSVFEQAVRADMLGRKGQRYFVISEAQIAAQIAADKEATG